MGSVPSELRALSVETLIGLVDHPGGDRSWPTVKSVDSAALPSTLGIRAIAYVDQASWKAARPEAGKPQSASPVGAPALDTHSLGA